MPNTAYWIVFAAILLPAAIYFTKAYQEKSAIADIRDFFPLKRTISSGEYRSTTVAAGMSLATVIIAFINLAPFLGITLIVSVVSFSLSFVLLYPCVKRIMEFNPENDSIQTYLGKTYQSDFVRYTALLFSMIGYISIFCMELIVGVTVLEPFLGKNVLIFSAIYLVFIVVYALMSGYRAIIATDKWQLRFIVAGISALVFFGFVQFNAAGQEVNATSLVASVSGSWVPMWSFIIGITVMNLPAPISDAGTWQRLCSTKDVKEARKGLVQVVIIFAIPLDRAGSVWMLLRSTGARQPWVRPIQRNLDHQYHHHNVQFRDCGVCNSVCIFLGIIQCHDLNRRQPADCHRAVAGD